MIFSRPTKFFIIEKVLLPLAIVPLRGLIKTWRIRLPESPKMPEIAATPHLVLATYHGMLFHLLAFAPLASLYGRRIVVMTSPSYDGRLLATFLRRFGIDNVSASSRSRNISGSSEFIRRIKRGDIGLIAVDGPQGPRCEVKPGFLKIAAVARAHLLLAVTSASRGKTFGTWDRAHLPAPFARIDLSLKLLPPPDGLGEAFSPIAETLRKMALDIASPMLGEAPTQTNLRPMITSPRLFAGVELVLLQALWFLTVWGAWQWTGASMWTAGGFLALGGIVATSVAVRRPEWKASGFRLDNLRPALMEVGVISFAFLAIFFLLIWAQGISFQPASNGRAIQLVASGVLQEAVFLGYLFQRWNALLLNPVAAVVANALSFALIHLPHLYLAALTALGGLVLGALFLRTRNVFAVGLAHGLLAALLMPTLRSAGVVATTQIGPPELFPLAAELARQAGPGDRIGIGPHGIALRQLGGGLTVNVETLGDPSAPDDWNRDSVLSFLKSRARVFCLLSEEDFQNYVTLAASGPVFLLGERYVWKRQFKFDRRILREFFLGSGDVPVLAAFRQRVLLLSNRPAA